MSENINLSEIYLTEDHLNWLVKSRSKNQRSSFKLHVIIKDNFSKIQESNELTAIASSLIAVNFSLWRAVFLSDLTEDSSVLLKDAQSFLKNLVVNNAVAYPQDRGAKEWTFSYYMTNAQSRFEYIVNSYPYILSKSEFLDTPNAGDKIWWAECQKSLNRAIKNFRAHLEG